MAKPSNTEANGYLFYTTYSYHHQIVAIVAWNYTLLSLRKHLSMSTSLYKLNNVHDLFQLVLGVGEWWRMAV